MTMPDSAPLPGEDRRFAPLTDSELAAIEARAEAAAPGPWKHVGSCIVEGPAYEETWVDNGGKAHVQCGHRPTIYDEGGHSEEDAEFIAHSRTDVPRLVAALRAAHAALRPFARVAAEHPIDDPQDIDRHVSVESVGAGDRLYLRDDERLTHAHFQAAYLVLAAGGGEAGGK